MAIGPAPNFIGTGAPTTIAATNASQSGDLGLVEGDSLAILNETGSTCFVILSDQVNPTASANGVGNQMVPAGGWGIVSRKGYYFRYYGVILAAGTGNVRIQVGFGG